ncbi:hypothetical protein EVAR_10411_1 [Eumeta japonica]|uniref:Uncharacterized protein n=1 Tax=Eumeta variegata TaxID=151549 RepID=A0A4C1UE09_EUMVA|nr:hypothetical protein EVAR_10411_1 [Eumeta japonica]
MTFLFLPQFVEIHFPRNGDEKRIHLRRTKIDIVRLTDEATLHSQRKAYRELASWQRQPELQTNVITAKTSLTKNTDVVLEAAHAILYLNNGLKTLKKLQDIIQNGCLAVHSENPLSVDSQSFDAAAREPARVSLALRMKSTNELTVEVEVGNGRWKEKKRTKWRPNDHSAPTCTSCVETYRALCECKATFSSDNARERDKNGSIGRER